MAKKMQFWLTDDEYKNIESELVTMCNAEGCSAGQMLKTIVLERFKGDVTVERDEGRIKIVG